MSPRFPRRRPAQATGRSCRPPTARSTGATRPPAMGRSGKSPPPPGPPSEVTSAIIPSATHRGTSPRFMPRGSSGAAVSNVLVNEAQLAAALPGYKIGSQIGKGAFGVVLRASDRLGREVAVKVMPRAEDDAAATAETEARILHQLRYPHIVEVFDFVPAGDIALIVMELLSPKSLRERLEEDAVSPEWACAAALALAGALEFAHGHGLVHRDVKPLNVLFTATGRLKLTDFGIAKAFGESATMSGTVLGTPTCMAPEQFL